MKILDDRQICKRWISVINCPLKWN